jgi:tetratricopeptide (TPR) repeat protein
MKLSAIVTCPNCKMQVLPKADGTCPSCQATILQMEKGSISKSIGLLKNSAASTSLKKEPPPQIKIKAATRVVDKGNKVSSKVENKKIATKHFDQSYEYWEKSNYEEALEECEEAIELAPDWSEAHNLRGVILEEMDKLDKAILEYREAIRLDPNNTDAKENLAYSDKSSRVLPVLPLPPSGVEPANDSLGDIPIAQAGTISSTENSTAFIIGAWVYILGVVFIGNTFPGLRISKLLFIVMIIFSGFIGIAVKDWLEKKLTK